MINPKYKINDTVYIAFFDYDGRLFIYKGKVKKINITIYEDEYRKTIDKTITYEVSYQTRDFRREKKDFYEEEVFGNREEVINWFKRKIRKIEDELGVKIEVKKE